MEHAWGQYNDPDTIQGIESYRRSGLTLWTPKDIKALGPSRLRSIARSCSDLIDGTYNGNYPQSAKNIDSFTESIAKGETLVFALSKNEKVLATASLVHRPNSMGGSIGLVELSKAAEHMEYAKDIQVRYLSKYRLAWAAQNLNQPKLYPFALLFALCIVVATVALLFFLDKILEFVSLHGAGGEVAVGVVMMTATAGVFSLPYLLRMQVSVAMRLVSCMAMFVVVLGWLLAAWWVRLPHMAEVLGLRPICFLLANMIQFLLH